MASLSDHHSGQFVKILYIGDSGTGKTGSLTSLVKAGYKLRILDMDNGLDILKAFVMHECKDKVGNVDYETRRDMFKMTQGGPVVNGAPKAYVEAVKLLNKWTDETVPAEWGPETILVIDSLTALGRAAYNWADGMNPGAKDKRQVYNLAQESVRKMIESITAEDFRTNVILISHVDYRGDEAEGGGGSVRGYVSAVGKALGPKIPTYFNTLVLAESVGAGQAVRRRIKTVPTGIVDLKTPVPFKIEKDLPLETGLAELFKLIKEN